MKQLIPYNLGNLLHYQMLGPDDDRISLYHVVNAGGWLPFIITPWMPTGSKHGGELVFRRIAIEIDHIWGDDQVFRFYYPQFL